MKLRTLVHLPSYESSASIFGPPEAADQTLADIEFAISRDPESFPEVGESGLRLALDTDTDSAQIWFRLLDSDQIELHWANRLARSAFFAA